MTVLVDSLRRIWAAKSRVPHQTGWGTCGSLNSTAKENILATEMYKTAVVLTDLARLCAPNLILILWNIFR